MFYIFDGVIMDEHPPWLKYWMPIHYDTIQDGRNKKSHLLFSFLVRIVLFLHFTSWIYLSKILLHHFICIIWIIHPLRKLMFRSKKPKLLCGDHHTRRFCLCTDASCYMRSAHVLNKHLPHVISEWAIRLLCNNGWEEFWSEPMKFLVDMISHAHWLRIFF